jgi:hypothetical protein
MYKQKDFLQPRSIVSVKNSKKSYHGYNTEVFYRVKTLPISALWEELLSL